MKIKNNRMSKNVLACMVAVEMFAMQFFVPPYITEEVFALKEPIFEEEKGITRKLSKRKNNPNLKSKRYTFEG